jgi:hypothetical protein
VLGRKPNHHTTSLVVSALAFTLVLFLSQTIWAVHIRPNSGDNKVIEPPGQTSSTNTIFTPVGSDEDKKKGGGIGSGLISLTQNMSTHGYGIAAGSSYPSLSESELSARFADMSKMGMTWVRFDVEWPNVQPDNSSQQHWNDYDKVVKAARAHNLKVLIILDYTPGWARVDGCDNTQCAPRDPNEFAAFASKAVKRYAPMGVQAWEVWNEPNNAVFWQPQVDAGAYTKLLQASFKAIKQADPNARVLTAGLAPMPSDGDNLSRRDFLQQMYNAGAKSHFDAVADHPYTFPRLPDEKSDRAWAEMSNGTTSMRGIMVANGDADKKIWITEFGAPTGGPGDTATPENGETIGGVWQVNEALQANILKEAVRLYKSYDWVGPFFWYSYRDAGDSSDSSENFFGLQRYDGSRKPAYDAYSQLAR